MSNFKEKIINRLKNNVYSIIPRQQKRLKLKEEQDNYEIEISKSTNIEMIVINLSILKKEANYLKNPPQDCDYVIVNYEQKMVYLIELKKSSSSSTALEINKQLEAGYEWLKHIFFIINYKLKNDFKIFKLCLRTNRRQDIRNYYEPNEYGVYNFNGNSLSLVYSKWKNL